MNHTAFTLEDLNKIADIFNLELVDMDKYYYWWGTTHDIRLVICRLENYAVDIRSFSQLSQVQWLEQLKTIVDQILSISDK